MLLCMYNQQRSCVKRCCEGARPAWHSDLNVCESRDLTLPGTRSEHGSVCRRLDRRSAKGLPLSRQARSRRSSGAPPDGSRAWIRSISTLCSTLQQGYVPVLDTSDALSDIPTPPGSDERPDAAAGTAGAAAGGTAPPLATPDVLLPPSANMLQTAPDARLTPEAAAGEGTTPETARTSAQQVAAGARPMPGTAVAAVAAAEAAAVLPEAAAAAAATAEAVPMLLAAPEVPALPSEATAAAATASDEFPMLQAAAEHRPATPHRAAGNMATTPDAAAVTSDTVHAAAVDRACRQEAAAPLGRVSMPPAAAGNCASVPEPSTVTAASLPEAAVVEPASTPKAAGAQVLTPPPSSKLSASEREPLEDGCPTPVATARWPHGRGSRSRSPASPDAGGGGGSGRSSGTGYTQPGSGAFAGGRQPTPEHSPRQPPASDGNQCSLGHVSPQPSTAEPRDAAAAPRLQLPALAVTPLGEVCVDAAPTLCSPAAGSLCQGPAPAQPLPPPPGPVCVSPAGSSPQSAQTQHPAAAHGRPATPPSAAWPAESPSPGSDYGSPVATLATARCVW